MSDLYNQIRLDIDEAKAQNHTLIGLKLDKAKAFDRVVPAFVAALFLAFGVPKGITNFFVKTYDGLHRHLSYRSWCSPSATTASNGVCQGCSLSLLATSVYTKVWCHLLEHLPDIFVRAYIDDSYLWCKLQRSQVLDQAIQVTKVWDSLSGQKLNEGKSSGWGISGKPEKSLKRFFRTCLSSWNLQFLKQSFTHPSAHTFVSLRPASKRSWKIQRTLLPCLLVDLQKAF